MKFIITYSRWSVR